MPRIRWTADDSCYGDFARSGRKIRPGESIDVDDAELDDYLSHRSGAWELVGDESDASDDADTEHTPGDSEGDDDVDAVTGDATDTDSPEAPFDPGDYTVADLREYLRETEYSDAELHAAGRLEADGKNRDTALDALEAQLSEA